MERDNLTIIQIFTLLCLVATVIPSKLNVARVLLPIFNDFPTNFSLHSTDESCFRWSATRDDLIQLNPVDLNPTSGCAKKVIVTTITKDKKRAITDILAEDITTSQILRCVVIVDEIKSLAITTTTKDLVLEEAPEVFEVRAYDVQGNEFSTLTGVPIHWIINSTTPSASQDNPVLKFITFKDSPYETPETLIDIEERHLKGHKILLEGVKTGMSKVSAKLPQSDYEHVRSNEILLTVVANLMIVPSEVYIMTGDTVPFKIIQTSYGISEELDLKSSQYYLDAENKDVAFWDKNKEHAVGVSEGETKIILRDKNIEGQELGVKAPTAVIYVVKPAYMMLSVLPHKNWAVLIAERLDIVAEVFSSRDRKLTLGPNVFVQTTVGDAFHVQERSNNGTWLTGWTQKEGVAEIYAELASISYYKLDPPLQAKEEIVIYPRIILSPSEVILPWDPVAKPKYDLELRATGGDGKFLWSSSNHTIGVVTQYGKVHTFNQGCFDVSVVMHRNHHNRQSAKFHILPPSRLQIVEYVMEAEVGAIIYLHVALYARKSETKGLIETDIPFTKCQELPFKVKLSDPRFIYKRDLHTDPIGLSCGNIAISSDEIGTSKVTVSYTTEKDFLMQDSVSITYFKPLKLMQPEGTILLAVGTTINLVFTGGPKQHFGKHPNKNINIKGTEYVRAIETTEQHTLPDDDEYTVVNVLCSKIGEADVVISASNPTNIPNCKSQETSVKVHVICGKPRSIELLPEIKVEDAKSCPMDLSAEKVVVQRNNDIDLIVKVKDDQGREFMNITSFKFDWLMKPKLGVFGTPNSISERDAYLGTVQLNNKSYQKISLNVDGGEIQILTALQGYRKDILYQNEVVAEWPPYFDEKDNAYDALQINASISLYLVDNTIITPNMVTIYNHPSNHRIIDVKQGSGYYQIGLNKHDVVEVKYLPKSRQLDIKPLNDGEITVQLTDLCLLSKPAIISITVVSVHFIRVEMSDKVEIGKCISCIVRMYDEFDNLLVVPNWDMIDLNYEFDNSIAIIKKSAASPSQPWNAGEVHFTITGVTLGDTKLTFSTGDSRYENFVRSAPMDLQVFPTLKLYPRNVTMSVGSQMQYTSKGGPQPTPYLEYSVADSEFAKISTNGLIKGIGVGTTKVTARALGTNPTTGQSIVYAEDTVDVKVIKIHSIKLAAPLTRFQVGATVPMWATGVPDHISPILLASIEPSVEFSWGVQDPSLVKLSSPLDNTGVHYESVDMMNIHLTGLAIGRTTVHLNATIMKSNRKSIMFMSFIDIEIFEKLALISPPNHEYLKPLLMGPFSTLQLKTNLDNMQDVNYKLQGETSSLAIHKGGELTPSGQLISINSKGVVQSFAVLGHALVVVTATDSNGLKQSLTIPIEVKPIYYMMLHAKTSWSVKPNKYITTVPVGTEIFMEASYYDNCGNKFTSCANELQVRSSRLDLITLKRGKDNSSFYITTKKPGVTAFKVWSDTIEKTADYFKLTVGQNINPKINEVTVGDIICFESPLTSVEKQTWITSDEFLLPINEDNGIATAIDGKGGQCSIIHSLHPGSPLQIRVNEIKDIYIPEVKNVLTNSNTPLKVHVVLRNEDASKMNNLISGWDCVNSLKEIPIHAPFTCEIDFDDSNSAIKTADLFEVTSKFDPEEGKYFCEIASLPEINKKYNTIPEMHVVLTARTSEVVSNSIKLKFVSAFYVPEEISLSDTTFTATVTVTGMESVLENLVIEPVDEKILYVNDLYLEGNKLSFVVKLLDYHQKLADNKDFMGITIKSPDTAQEVLVMTKVQSPEKFSKKYVAGLSSDILMYLHANRKVLSVVLSFLLVFIGSLYFYATYSKATVTVNMTTTPIRSCIEHINRSSSSVCEPGCYCHQSPEIRRNRRYM